MRPSGESLRIKYREKSANSNPWVLVTGASDGIGAGYCRYFAALGFNVCLVSRTLSKLITVEQELKKITPEVQTRVIVADFSLPEASFPKYFTDLLDKVKDLDISVVIANAGLLHVKPLAKKPAEKLEQILDVNVYHYTMMAKVFIPWLETQRGKSKLRSAFIGVSSSSYLRYMPSFLTYSASKSFATKLTTNLVAQAGAVFVQTVVPFATATNVVQDNRINLVGTPVDKAVKAFCDQLANDYQLVFGTLASELIAKFSFCFCGSFLSPVFDYACFHIPKLINH